MQRLQEKIIAQNWIGYGNPWLKHNVSLRSATQYNGTTVYHSFMAQRSNTLCTDAEFSKDLACDTMEFRYLETRPTNQGLGHSKMMVENTLR